MPVPSPRNQILPARGNYADLAAEVASLADGEICYAYDQDQYYQNEGGTLVAVGATKAQGVLADSAVQPGDNISTLTNDSGYITLAEVPAGGVTSVAGKTGDVTLVKADLTDFADADYATAAQGALADTAVQPGDLATVATSGSYNDLTDQPSIPSAAPVDSVNSQTGAVVLDADDIDDTATVHKFATAAQLSAADTAVQPGDLATVATSGSYDDLINKPDLSAKADLVGGVLDVSQLPDIAVSEYKGNVADETAMLAVTGEKGDWVIRNDDSKVYVITGDDPSVVGSWTALAYPAGFSGAYDDLTGKPTLGTAAATDATDYASAAQGLLADSATQPGDNVSTLNNDAGYITSAQAPGTDLSYTASTRVLASSTGTDATLPEVTAAGDSGLMTGADKTKLDGIAAGAQVNTIDSVNSQTGTVVLDLDDIDGVNLTTTPPNAGEVLGYNGSEWVPTENTGAGSTLNSTRYRYESNTDINTVAAGKVRFNSTTLTLVTEIAFSNIDKNGVDIGAILQNMVDENYSVYFQQEDNAGKAVLFHFTGPCSNVGDSIRSKFPVEHISDSGSALTNNKDCYTALSAQATADSVTSVNGQQGAVVLTAADVGAATSAQGALADTATQPGDNISTLTNDAGYITSAPGTNLGVTTTTTSNTITSSTGTNATIGEATGSAAGLMSTAHHNKLDGIASNATNVTNNNQLTNGAGYITSASLGNYNNGSLYTFDASGNFTATGNVTAYSDVSLKENIEVIPNALEKVSAIRGVTYDRKDMEGSRQAGVIAQEVEAVLPEVVLTNEEGVKSVAYGNLVGLLVEAIKELKAEVEELKK